MELPTVDALLASMGRQRDLYRAMMMESGRQKAALEAQDTQALLEILDRKRRLVTALDEVDRQVAPWRARWPEVRDSLSAEDRGRVEAVVDEVGGVLQSLLALEEECTRMAAQGIAATGEEIRGVAEARRANSAYRPPTAGESKFLDRTE